jgi:hypothetical protein
MKFSLLRKELKAVSRFASTKDIRYYLCGVHVVQDNRGTYIEATNGHMLGRLLIENSPREAAQVTIPNEAIKTLAGTSKNGDEWLHFTIDGIKIHVLTGNNEYTFQAVDGNFPDCDRVIPLVLKKEDEAPACFNPEYLMAFQLAAQDIKNSRKGASPSLSILQRGNQSALVNIGVENFIGVVMPIRDGVGASVPEWCYKAREVAKETEAVAA